MTDLNDRRGLFAVRDGGPHRGRTAAMLCAIALAFSGAAAAQDQNDGSGAGNNRGRIGDRVRTIDHSIEVYIGENTVQAQYVRDLDVGGGIGRVQARAGVFYDEERDLIGVADLLTPVGDRDLSENRALEFSVGARAYGALLGIENTDIFSIGIGGEVEYFFNRTRRKTSLRVSGFYAPDISTFGEADNLTDVTARLLTRVRDNTDVFVGYRLLKIDTTTFGHRNVDDNVHIGFRRSF